MSSSIIHTAWTGKQFQPNQFSQHFHQTKVFPSKCVQLWRTFFFFCKGDLNELWMVTAEENKSLFPGIFWRKKKKKTSTGVCSNLFGLYSEVIWAHYHMSLLIEYWWEAAILNPLSGFKVRWRLCLCYLQAVTQRRPLTWLQLKHSSCRLRSCRRWQKCQDVIRLLFLINFFVFPLRQARLCPSHGRIWQISDAVRVSQSSQSKVKKRKEKKNRKMSVELIQGRRVQCFPPRFLPGENQFAYHGTASWICVWP